MLGDSHRCIAGQVLDKCLTIGIIASVPVMNEQMNEQILQSRVGTSCDSLDFLKAQVISADDMLNNSNE